MLETLKTRRLTLRPLGPEDAAVITHAINNLAVSQWLTQVPYPYTSADAAWFIAENVAGRMHARLIWEKDRFIGAIGIDGELGYWLSQDAWGAGYATEAAIAVVDDFFAHTDIDGLFARHHSENNASRNVLNKLGFIDTSAVTLYSKALSKDMAGRLVHLTRSAWEARADG